MTRGCDAIYRNPRSKLHSFCREIPYWLKGSPDGLPIPPADLRMLITRKHHYGIPDYFEIGRRCAERVLGILRKNGVVVPDLRKILDFGSGSGRIVRHLACLKDAKLYGTDINPQQIAWCSQNLPVAQFAVNQPCPPLIYPDATFDLIYTFSVFTHLGEAAQFMWMHELSRVLRPGGHLLITTHGESYLGAASQYERQQFRAGRLVVRDEQDAGNPSTYGNCCTYHPVEYVKQKLAIGFEVVDFIAGKETDLVRDVLGQDWYLWRRPR